MTAIRQFLGITFLGTGLLCGQQGNLSGPVTGMVFDRGAHSLRPVLGIPGASLMGDPVSLGIEATSVWISPGQETAVALATDGGLHWFRLAAGTAPSEFAVDEIGFVPQTVVFSPSGTAAALVAGDRLQVVQGLPGAPKAGAAFQLPVVPSVRPRLRKVTLAVNDDASYLLWDNAGSVRLLSPTGENRKLLDVAGPIVLAFAPGSADAAIVDRQGAGVVLFRNLKQAGNPSTLAPSDERIAAAQGVAFSADGQRLFLAATSGVDVWDLAQGARSTVSCACRPAGMTPMGRVFRLNDAGTEPLWLFDPGAEPKIVFVPPAVAAAGQ